MHASQRANQRLRKDIVDAPVLMKTKGKTTTDDGTTTKLELKHTFTISQLQSFRTGSALNCIAH